MRSRPGTGRLATGRLDRRAVAGGHAPSGLMLPGMRGRAAAPAAPVAPPDPLAIAEAALAEAEAHRAAGNPVAAEAAYERAIAARPATTAAFLGLGALRLAAGRLAEARQAYEQVLLRDRQAVGARWHLALIALEEGEPARATAQLTWLKQATPDMAEAYLLQATAHEVAGDRQAACFELTTLIERQPEHAGARVRLGKLRLAMGDRAGALTALDEACRLTPEDGEAQFARGRLLEAAGLLAEAAEAYRLALAGGYAAELVAPRLEQVRRRRFPGAGIRGVAA